MKGYVGADGKIYVFVGARALTKLAVVSMIADAFEVLLFDNAPGVPAENRWLTLSPMVAWTQYAGP